MTIDEFGQFASAIKTYFPKDNLPDIFNKQHLKFVNK